VYQEGTNIGDSSRDASLTHPDSFASRIRATLTITDPPTTFYLSTDAAIFQVFNVIPGLDPLYQ
jgi:hypothetical protein